MKCVTTEHPAREAILVAAAQAIASKSYNACGLSEILKAAQVAKGSFYHFFPSKESLGVEVIRKEAEVISASLQDFFFAREGCPIDRLKAYYRAIGQACEADGLVCRCPIAKLALEVAHLSEPMRQAIDDSYADWALQHEALLRNAREQGVVPSGTDVRWAADAIINGFEGAALRMQTSRSLAPIEHFVETTIDRLVGRGSY